MRHLNLRQPERGLTLIEVLVVLAIVAILAVAGAPALGEYSANARLREGGNLLLGETMAARSEAVKRNAQVRVSTNGSLISVEEITSTSPLTTATLRTRTLPDGVQLATGIITFDSEGRPTPFGTVGSIDLSMTGRTCNSDTRCPGLRVEAGGAARLCSDRTQTGC
jgi:type IV fimbrial biogenesis protein FimT